MAAYYFPSSRYLSEKWWHRLAIVIFWSWVAVAVFATGVGLSEEGMGITSILIILIMAASPLVPSVVYRVILFIAMNGAWKDRAA